MERVISWTILKRNFIVKDFRSCDVMGRVDGHGDVDESLMLTSFRSFLLASCRF